MEIKGVIIKPNKDTTSFFIASGFKLEQVKKLLNQYSVKFEDKGITKLVYEEADEFEGFISATHLLATSTLPIEFIQDLFLLFP